MEGSQSSRTFKAPHSAHRSRTWEDIFVKGYMEQVHVNICRKKFLSKKLLACILGPSVADAHCNLIF